MEGKKLFRSIRLQNLLSYGGEGVELELEPLNVLIGPNASGKSNLLAAFSLLAAAPRDLLKPLREGGGAVEWIWKGLGEVRHASVEASIEHGNRLIRYGLAFTAVNSRFELIDEFARFERRKSKINSQPPLKKTEIYSYGEGRPRIRTKTVSGRLTIGDVVRPLKEISPEQSILSQIRGGEVYPELTYLGKCFEEIYFFGSLGRGNVLPRLPQRVDLPEDFLQENAGNLGLVLGDLFHQLSLKRRIVEELRRVDEDIEDISTRISGGTILPFLHERGIGPISLLRVSEGTLNYLCLLAILMHPNPPPLICLEGPEVGLHPDVIRQVAKLLIDASQRTQLIVTTHSEVLVSALSELPEAVVVCERDSRGTRLRRLEPKHLQEWLDRQRARHCELLFRTLESRISESSGQ